MLTLAADRKMDLLVRLLENIMVLLQGSFVSLLIFVSYIVKITGFLSSRLLELRSVWQSIDTPHS